MRFTRPAVDRNSEINLTPLIDVVFLLLIFFMVTTTFSREAEIRLHLPEANSASTQEAEPHPLIVQINAIGQFSVQGHHESKPRELLNTRGETLRKVLQSAAGDRTDPMILIRADRLTPHEAVVKTLDAARQLGWYRITFATGLPDNRSGSLP